MAKRLIEKLAQGFVGDTVVPTSGQVRVVNYQPSGLPLVGVSNIDKIPEGNKP